jgi:hypothetical protein
MSKFGTVGRVRFWITARVVVYGEPGASSEGPSSAGGGVTVGPCAGPLAEPEIVGGCSRGAGLEKGSGAVAVGMLVGSILVAIGALQAHLRVSPLAWSLARHRPRRCLGSRFRAFWACNACRRASRIDLMYGAWTRRHLPGELRNTTCLRASPPQLHFRTLQFSRLLRI